MLKHNQKREHGTGHPSNYYNYTQSSYDDLALRISAKLEEYKKNARSVYGHISDISSLEQRAGELYGNAQFGNENVNYDLL